MVNVDSNFNRNYTRKRKYIRDKKRAKIRGKKKLFRVDEQEKPKTKREIKKEKRKEKRKESILKAARKTA